jgi:membrane fusion protein, multidrug efflux system
MRSASTHRFLAPIRRPTPRNARLSVPIALAAAALLDASCSQAPARSDGPEAVPVIAAAVARKDVPVELREIGAVQAYATVAIRAEVGGVLKQVHFREGQDVHTGDLLFTIDARPYEAALESSQAALAKDSVQLETARADVVRYGSLIKKEYVNQEEFDRIRTNAASLEAAVRADHAAVQNASVELEHCTIRSPINGRTGQLMVNAGNLIKANGDNPLVVINQIDPIYVAFSVPEQSLPEIQESRAAGEVEVRAMLGGGREPLTGTLSFLDNTVDRGTGTIHLKATFVNRDRVLWPGQFVNVSLKVSVQAGALTVPSQAIQTGQQGTYVYVVKSDQIVESRPVVAGAAVGSETIVVKGLEAGETVVTDGQLRLVPGAKVVTKSALSETRP